MTGGLGMPGIVVDPSAANVGVGGMDMNAAAATMGFNLAGGGGDSASSGAPATAVGTSAGGTDMSPVSGMVDPSMYGAGLMDGGYDDRSGAATGAYGMEADARRAGM